MTRSAPTLGSGLKTEAEEVDVDVISAEELADLDDESFLGVTRAILGRPDLSADELEAMVTTVGRFGEALLRLNRDEADEDMSTRPRGRQDGDP